MTEETLAHKIANGTITEEELDDIPMDDPVVVEREEMEHRQEGLKVAAGVMESVTEMMVNDELLIKDEDVQKKLVSELEKWTEHFEEKI